MAEIPDYPSNSIRRRRDEPREETRESPRREVVKIVKGRVFRKKPSVANQLSEAFLGDSAENVGRYILFDVLVPAAKATISEMIGGAIEMLLFGEARPRSRGGDRRDKPSYVSYTSYSDRRDPPRKERRSENRLDELVLEYREDAQNVLDELIELTELYGSASVHDLFDLMNVPATHADLNWGWEDLSRVQVIRVRDGYLIDFPRPRPID